MNTLVSFTPFPRLPWELQVKIWGYWLKSPYVGPRLVVVKYNMHSDSFAYISTPPPILRVCRSSREAALKFYLILVSDSTSTVYFNPVIDYLYCKPLLPPVAARSPSVRPSIPFISPEIKLSLIRNLVLDQRYWHYRMMQTNAPFPIKELQDFHMLQRIFLVVPPPLQWLEELRRLREAFPRLHASPIFDLDRRYACQAERHASALLAPVPGFRIHPTSCAVVEQATLKNCFGWIPNLNPNIPPSEPLVYTFVAPWDTQELPTITEIWAIENLP